MKVTINREHFLKSIKICSAAIANKTVIPIYSAVKMSIEDGMATFTGGNGNVQISSSCTVDANESFGICLPPGLLIGTLSSITEETITFNCKRSDNNTISIVLSSGRNRYKMTGFPAEHYPMMKFSDIPEVTVKSHDFQKALSNASSCVDQKELREVMRGCKVTVEGRDLKIYGISNHFMTRQVIGLVGVNDRIDDFIIPAEISSYVSEVADSGDTNLSFDGKVIKIAISGIVIKAVALYGTYPNFESVANRIPETCIKFVNSKMLESLKRLRIYANNSYVVKLKAKKTGEISMITDDSDIGKAAVEYLDENVYSDFEDIEKWYNLNYMSNIFSKLDTSENTVINLSENNNIPAFISAENNTDVVKQMWIVAGVDPLKIKKEA